MTAFDGSDMSPDQAAGFLDGVETLYWAVMDSPGAAALDLEMAAAGLEHAQSVNRAAMGAAAGPEREAELEAG